MPSDIEMEERKSEDEGPKKTQEENGNDKKSTNESPRSETTPKEDSLPPYLPAIQGIYLLENDSELAKVNKIK